MVLIVTFISALNGPSEKKVASESPRSEGDGVTLVLAH